MDKPKPLMPVEAIVRVYDPREGIYYYTSGVLSGLVSRLACMIGLAVTLWVPSAFWVMGRPEPLRVGLGRSCFCLSPFLPSCDPLNQFGT